MAKLTKDDQFSPEETKQRYEAAIRGARITGHKPMSEIKRKLSKPKTKQTEAAKRPAT